MFEILTIYTQHNTTQHNHMTHTQQGALGWGKKLV